MVAITWLLPDYREPLGLCLFRWRLQTHQKPWIIRKNHQPGPLMSKWVMCNPDPSLHLTTASWQTHTWLNKPVDTSVQTHACTCMHHNRFFLIYLIKSPHWFSRTGQRCRDLSPFPSLCASNPNSCSCALNYKTNGSFLSPDNAAKGVVPASVFTNAGRGCCYLQPVFFTAKSIISSWQQIWNSDCKGSLHGGKEIPELCGSQSSVRDTI